MPALAFEAPADTGPLDASGEVDAAPPPADARRRSDVEVDPLPDATLSPRDAAPGDTGAALDAAASKPDAGRVADTGGTAPDVPGLVPVPDAAGPAPIPDANAPPVPDANALPVPEVVALTVPGPVTGRRFGSAVAIVPDQNGDGFADLLVGAPRTGPRGGADSSALHLLDGRTGAALSSFVERDDPNDFGAEFVAAPFADDRDAWQVIAGAKGANGGAGRLSAYALPGLRRLDVVDGQVAGAQLGQTVTPAFEDGRPLVMVSTPGIVIAPRLTIYGLRADGHEDYTLEQRLRVDADVLIASNVGVNLLGIPTPQGGGLDDVVAVGESGIIATRRVMRYRSAGTAEFRGEYVTPDADLTTGTSLLELPGAPPWLAVGTPGRDAGKVAVFVRDGGANGDPLLEMRPLGPASLFGWSLALAPLLAPPADATPLLCLGAPGGAPGLAGSVECRAAGAEVNALALDAPPDVAGFGRSLAVATRRDPDDTWLLVVGAPETSTPEGVTGGVVLYRVTSPP